MVALGDSRYFTIESGGTPDSSNPEFWEGDINWVTLVDLPQGRLITEISSTSRKLTSLGLKKSSAKLLPPDTVLVSSRATIGRIGIARVPIATNQGFKNIVIKDHQSVEVAYVAYVVSHLVPDMIRLGSGGTYKEISKTNFSRLEVPLPPLEVQKEIVAELDGYQRVIDGAQQIVENWKPTIKIDSKWEMLKLADVCEINPESGDPKKLFGKRDFVYVDIDSVPNGGGQPSFSQILSTDKAPSRARRIIRNGDVLLSTVRPNLKAFAIASEIPDRVIASTGFAVLRPDARRLVPHFLYYMILDESLVGQMISRMGKGSYPSINQTDVADLTLALPQIDVQKEIVAGIQTEQHAVESAKELIRIYEQRTRNRLTEVWGE